MHVVGEGYGEAETRIRPGIYPNPSNARNIGTCARFSQAHFGKAGPEQGTNTTDVTIEYERTPSEALT